MKRSQKLPPMSGKCRPGHFAADARYSAARAVLLANKARARRSALADNLLLLLLGLLLLAGASNCTTARPPEAHATTGEHAAPVAWHESDSLTD